MRIRFFGTRGSVAASPTSEAIQGRIRNIVASAVRKGIREDEIDSFLESQVSLQANRFFGGNTSCVAVETGGQTVIIDAGTGLRPLGQELAANENAAQPHHLLLSHYHWDHICGFPFFAPAYMPGRRICVWGGLPGLEDAIRSQQLAPHFPVPLDQMSGEIEFRPLPESDPVDLGALSVRAMRLHHPGGSYGFRLEGPAGAFVYLSDTEILHLEDDELARYRDFIDGADTAVVDAQYTFAEGIEKIAWGHSTALSFIDICHDLNLERLIMFHHDPGSSDEKIEEMEEAARNYQDVNAPEAAFTVSAAYDGMVIDLGA